MKKIDQNLELYSCIGASYTSLNIKYFYVV